jgi:hypothetical protein
MTHRRFLGLILPTLLTASVAVAHPGAGIALDDAGTIYFTDTGMGVWKLLPDGEPELISRTAYHWFGLDRSGAFASSPQRFGEWFGRATEEGDVPAIVVCSDYPMAVGADGNLYYADTRQFPPLIKKRTPSGDETVLATMTEESPTAADGGPGRYVQGLTYAPDGSLYVMEAAATAEYVSIRKVAADGALSSIVRDFVPTELKYEEGRPSVAPSSVPPGEPVPQLSWTYCRGLTVADDGTIFVAANAARAVLAIGRDRNVRVVLRAEAPWGPTDVTIHDGTLYVLEYDDRGEDRRYWLPRVRKVGARGAVETIVTVTRD